MSWNCLYPWKSIYVHPDGSIRPCCIQKIQYGHTKDGDDILSVWNGEKAQALRKSFISGEFVEGCEPCREKEKNLGKSLRTSFRKNVLKDNSEEEVDFKSLPTKAPLEIEHLDLSFSNKCNLKCRFCGPYNSTSWFEDADKLLSMDRKFWISYMGKTYESNQQSAQHYIELAEKLTKLKRIELQGGEPFLVKEQIPFLQSLVASGRSKNIELIYTTNGTVILPEVQSLFTEFKQITITLSVDGVGDLYQYIRGGRFRLEEAVERNIQFYNQFTNLNMIIHFTICAYNILNLKKMVEWADDAKLRHGVIRGWQAGLVVNPKPLQITRLPLSIRRAALEQINNHPQLSNITSILENEPTVEDVNQWSAEFIRYTDGLDAIRKTSFYALVPEFKTSLYQ